MTPNKHGGDDPYIGQVLDGKYRIDTLLGQGGMGAVYRATHILMDHQCAVKVLHSSMLADPSSIPRFQREARAAARIRHQNAIAVNDFGITSDNVVYLVMEFFPGHSLREMIRAGVVFTPERTAKIIDRVAAALDAAHQQGIIHRDVKPDNVMLRELPNGEDEVKVLDFGIAKMVDQQSLSESLTITGTIIGTPHYLSPEQCRAATDLDARSDLYSLAVVTYEMLTGVVPFVAGTPIAVAMMHISDPPPTLVDKVPGISPEAESVIHRAMAKKREDRQPSVIEFGREFFEAVMGYSPAREGGGTSLIGGRQGYPSSGGYPLAQRGVSTGETDAPGRGTVAITPGSSTGQTTMPTPPGGFRPGTGTGQRAVSDGVPTPSSITGSNTVVSGSISTNTPNTVMYAPGAVGGPAVVPAPTPPSHRFLIAAVAAVLLAAVAGLVAWASGAFTPKRTEIPVVLAPPVDPKTTIPTGMVYIPGGTFQMGRDSGDAYEGPVHTVTVKPFYLDKTEVTNKQYAEFVQATGYAPPTDWVNGSYKVGTGDLPVVNVEWKDARAYAEWAKKRLPKEEEWEFAARGTDGRLYPWGNEWVSGNAYTKESKLTTLQPVGSAANGASPFGVLDMSGNVWEWCEDNFRPYVGSTAEAKDPTYKIIRGGSLGDDKTKAMTTYRNWVPPEQRYEALGFRCARSVE
jgi:formylglycine-generating enzyme required for sulfatase activity/serine/threonine protein kinase